MSSRKRDAPPTPQIHKENKQSLSDGPPISNFSANLPQTSTKPKN